MESTKFDWTIYADATLAGLSVLIPLPFVDGLFESFFRRRMLGTIATRRKETLAESAPSVINGDKRTIWQRALGCLFFPFWFTFQLVAKLSKKLLYFLTVKSAVDALNYYWQRAFLIDHMVREGHLSADEVTLFSADSALETVLATHVRSPLTELAREIVGSPARIWRSLRHARKGQEDDTLLAKQDKMEKRWYQFDAHFRILREEYQALFAANQLAAAPLVTVRPDDKPTPA